MPSPSGFSYDLRPDGTVVVWHHGRAAAKLRGDRATRFLAESAGGDPQLVMARWTGNYKRGNERTASRHPRNGR
ncbi:hypothetical protein GCM10010495_39170 [Kitasatospora herbaricolor]|uniref:Uncharacterized protein n=1 Tax=Kitasatospora herbaricolor TaxID=68217 RepID=A0ABZ1W094_9ACTN|nr:hypothetical protein [Kitasatospora herbaricolor]MDQ0313259.1 hypothetical protein [Kitasatospora herbaricolor]GGV20192.1 hypothetical protein GCM10010495_39170 [Kitasatospora herbaricolor]